ncbi:MAG: hypothetical protein MJ010_03055 [Paludibacteraceae bacterium]|nr:hypothetical protein [Paludibacteraceae bacterium]
MKRLSFMAMSALLVLGVASCKKNSDVQNPESKEGMVKMVFSAVSNESKEKTSISGSDILWSEGDIVKIYAGSSTTGNDFTLTEGDGTTSATFEGWIAETATAPYYAVYPSSAAQGIDGSAIKYSIPAEQAYVENSFATGTVPMVAYSEADKSLAFKNQTAFIKLQLTGAGTIETMTLESASNNICGTFNVSKTDPTASSTAVEEAKKITVTGISGTELDASEAKNVIIAVAPANFAAEDLTLSMTDSEGKAFSTKLGAISAGRSQGKAVAINVEFVTPAPTRPACQSALDADANWVQIGEQYWLKENTKCIEYDTESEAFEAGITTISTSSSSVYTPYYTASTKEEYGYYYNWAAAVGVKNGQTQTEAFTGNRQGICPNGSHIPTVDEWNALKTFIETTDGKGKNMAGKHLKSNTPDWKGTKEHLDTYGFAALPTGYAIGSGVLSVGSSASFWTATPSKANGSDAYDRYLGGSYDDLDDYAISKSGGRSVRCLRD